MTRVAWREDDFEEHGFDPRMFTSGGVNTSIVEKEPFFPFWIQGAADIVWIRPDGRFVTVEAKVDPKIKPKHLVIWPHSWDAPWADRENLIKIQRHVYASLIDTAVVLSRSSIDEPSRQEERSASASAYASLWEDEEQQNEAAAHPLTKSVYEQLAGIPKATREAIQVVLNHLATSVPKDETRKLPPLRLALLEDSSYLLEWTFKDRRLGFSFETDPKDSGWYYVYSSDSSERYESGTMDQLEMSRLVRMTLKP